MLKVTLLVLLATYIGFGIILYIKQKDMLYFPTPNLVTNYDSLVLKDGDISIYVHVLNEGHKNAILYFGGNAESMAESTEYIAQQFPNFTCYLMDYRGYGSSNGEPSEVLIYKDALALYDEVKFEHARISIGGRSLGTGVATYVAARREVVKLALITPYDSIQAVAQDMYPIYPMSLLLKDKYISIANVKDIKSKTFIVIAENDKLIPKKHSLRLMEAFEKEQITTAVIKNRGHGDISSDERYYKIMQDFIGEG